MHYQLLNTIYPQTMIVIDLNNIQFINDTLGYEEGDKQIKSAANILIKTQLDNSDIMSFYYSYRI
mgnify:CR=1 FL=1